MERRLMATVRETKRARRERIARAKKRMEAERSRIDGLSMERLIEEFYDTFAIDDDDPPRTAQGARSMIDSLKLELERQLRDDGRIEPGTTLWRSEPRFRVGFLPYGRVMKVSEKLAGGDVDVARFGYFRMVRAFAEAPGVYMLCCFNESWYANLSRNESFEGNVRDRPDKKSCLSLTCEHSILGRETYVALIEGPEKGAGRSISGWELMPGGYGEATHFMPRVRGEADPS